jgi:alkylation response protein AidB-like acyl-CoA dehydrogenase
LTPRAADASRCRDEGRWHEDDTGVVHGEAVHQRSGRARANEGVQIHGGYGFIKDYPAEKFYRDVKLCTIGEGTSEIQRLVIAKTVVEGAPSRPWKTARRDGLSC